MSVQPPAGSHRRNLIAGLVGNILEWYDFSVYGYFAAVIGRHFFPSDNPITSLIAAFGVFAAGYLMRPLGGVVFGHIGDRLGRKAALTLSVLAMAVPTFVVGLLPDHAQIGLAAPVLLVVMRMVQGLAVGGEFTTSIVFMVESAPPNRRGFAGSWSSFGATAGVLLGSAVGTGINSWFAEEAVEAWAWRLPFLAGLVVGLAGLVLRRHLPETKPATATEAGAGLPLFEAFRTEWVSIVKVVGLNAINGVGFYMIFVYAVTFMEEIVHLPAAQALKINTISMVLLLVLGPFMGMLSDRFGRKPVMLIGVGGIVLFAYPFFWLMHHSDFWLDLLGEMGFALFLSPVLANIPVTMVEAFPTRVRCTALSVSYNLCLGLLGGTTPMVATYLVEMSQQDLAPAVYLMAAAFVSLVVILTLPETHRAPLRD